ncbi:MAG: type III pantothenate kinase [Anaerolineae bacterium]
MLLAIDIGNTNLTFGVFDGKRQLQRWRAATRRSRTADEHGVLLTRFLRMAGLEPEQIAGCVISSVVPPLTAACVTMARTYLHTEPLVVGPGVRTKMRILYDNPAQLGADRLIDAVGARDVYGAPVIVVDFGTATTFNVVDGDGNYRGGAIAPGIGVAAEALVNAAAQLPRIELVFPPRVTATSTSEAMQSGVLYGYLGLVEGLVRRLQVEWGDDVTVVATGGLAGIVAERTDAIDVVDQNLTLEGLRVIWEINRNVKRET